MQQKKILILGSTGSIGTQTLDIVRCFPEKFCLVGALVLKNTNLLQQQVDEFLLDSVCIIHEEKAKEFSRNNPKRKVYSGQNGALQMIQESDVELVVLSVVGEAGVVLAKEVLQHKKNLALATKEVIVSDGREILQIAKKHNTQIFPIDSEHSAIWQCLHSGKKKEVEKIWLTCSGGPFRDPVQWPKEKLKNATISDALCHPNWKMGKKYPLTLQPL
jgi:1-deoxy-D-xylulose-5-phosphate reductoisomerase